MKKDIMDSKDHPAESQGLALRMNILKSLNPIVYNNPQANNTIRIIIIILALTLKSKSLIEVP